MRELTSAEWSLPALHHWQVQWEEYQRDTGVGEDDQAIDQQRAVAQQEMQAVLNQFLEQKMTVGELNAVFQHKTHREWKGFGIRGPAGLFFKKLIEQRYLQQAQVLSEERAAVGSIDGGGECHVPQFPCRDRPMNLYGHVCSYASSCVLFVVRLLSV
jgi:hypothetical protein